MGNGDPLSVFSRDAHAKRVIEKRMRAEMTPAEIDRTHPTRASLGEGDFLPINLSISGRICVVVGGGPVAERKVRALLEAHGRVMVVAPDLCEGLEELAAVDDILWHDDPYASAILDGAFLVVAATDDPLVNAAVVRDARERGVLVNAAGDAGEGDFVMPGVVRRGGLLLTVSTSGSSPTLAAVVREEVETSYTAEWEAIVRLFGALRGDLKAVAGESGRRRIVRKLLADSHLRAMLKEGRDDDALAQAKQCLSSWSE